jgi:NAD(P)-dependent dehydrogenase (short-subunit alcohol dehydrogenase family)
VDLELRNRGAVVTGASRGIGRAVAVRLGAEGARVLLVARSEGALRNAAGECGSRAATLALDVNAPDAPERIAAAAADSVGTVEILVNSAGISADLPLDRLTVENFQAQWDVNVLAPLRLMQTFAPPMAARGGGSIVNVVSAAARFATGTNAAYSVAKAGELCLTRAFADRYAGAGVRINAVNPGPVDTDLWLGPDGLASQIAARQGVDRDQVLATARAGTPRRRFASPDEIASVVVLLCSPVAANVVGAGWQVDGGAVPVI